MKKLILIVACFIGLSTIAQQTLEISPYSTADPMHESVRDTFNLQFLFPCDAFVGEYGVETNGTDIYMTQWYGDTIAKYDQFGNVLDVFTIPGVERIRDMAFDGQYYYGGNAHNYFYILDLDNKVLIDTVHTSFNVRGMAYDPIEDVLWTSGDWEPDFHKIDMQGNILDYWMAAGVTMHSITGLAFDNYTYGGPSLWGFSQDSTGVMIVKYDIATQTQTGNMIDMSSIAEGGFGYAGGLFINEMSIRSGITLGGIIQNDVVFAFDLEYANMMVVGIDNHDMLASFDVYPNPVSNILNISLETDNLSNVTCSIFNQIGQLVYQQDSQLNQKGTLSIETGSFETGTYFVQLSGSGFNFTKKFIKN